MIVGQLGALVNILKALRNSVSEETRLRQYIDFSSQMIVLLGRVYQTRVWSCWDGYNRPGSGPAGAGISDQGVVLLGRVYQTRVWSSWGG